MEYLILWNEDNEIQEEISTDLEDEIVGEEEHDNEEEFDPFNDWTQ